MDMGGMGQGMDMSSDGMFKSTNMYIARLYWYLVAAVVAVLAVQRGVDWARSRSTYAAEFLSFYGSFVLIPKKSCYAQATSVYDSFPSGKHSPASL